MTLELLWNYHLVNIENDNYFLYDSELTSDQTLWLIGGYYEAFKESV